MENTGVYCQSRNVKFGGYREFDHEPTSSEIAEAVSKILNQILDSIFIRKLDEARVILKTPKDFKNMVSDPLGETAKNQPDRWTVGVKIRAKMRDTALRVRSNSTRALLLNRLRFNLHHTPAKPRWE